VINQPAMNQEHVGNLFQSFFDATLKPLGFMLRTPLFAERPFAGMRQGIVWKLDNFGGFASFGCHAFWSFTHELDDATPHAALGDYGGCLSGGSTPDIAFVGELSDTRISQRFEEVAKNDLPVLNRLNSVEQVLADLERYPASAHRLIGNDSIVTPFNHAFCLEIAGRKEEAGQRYHAIVQSLASDPSSVAERCRTAAQKRAAGPGVVATEAVREQRPEEAARENERSFWPEPGKDFTFELARKILPFKTHPSYALPSTFVKAIDKVYFPNPTFWRSIDAEDFLVALESLERDYMTDLYRSWEEMKSKSFLEEFAHEIRTRQFDEYCAARLLSIPQGNLPADDAQTYAWLSQDLLANDEHVFLEYLEFDGPRSIPHIQSMMLRMQSESVPSTT
jgi:hypothetical protein